MSWWKRKKCATCKKVLKPEHGIHELRLNTAEGVIDMEVCGECSRFWDMSAEILNRGKKNDETV